MYKCCVLYLVDVTRCLESAGKAIVLESLPDLSSGTADLAISTQAAPSRTGAEASSKVTGKSKAGAKGKQSLGTKRQSAAASKAQHTMPEVLEISDDDDEVLPGTKVARAHQ